MLRLLSRARSGVGSFVSSHPRISFYGVGFVVSTLGVHRYMKHQTKALEFAVYNKIEKGSIPPVLHTNNMVSRKDVSEEIVNLFFPYGDETGLESGEVDKEKRTFGLIMGPTGTGKTALVTSICNRFSAGVLYYEVREPKAFVTGLAKSVSMKIGPSSIFDLFLGYFSTDYFMYYRLPETQEIALDTIFEVLESAARRYKSVHGKVPTLFINSADVLAKHEENLFVHLVAHAKRVANAGILTIVLVSSEGSILPVVQKLSGVSRCSKLFEVN